MEKYRAMTEYNQLAFVDLEERLAAVSRLLYPWLIIVLSLSTRPENMLGRTPEE